METKREKRIVIDLKGSIWSRNDERRARPEFLPEYVETALEMAGECITEDARTIVLTGAAPAWLYLALAHAIHDHFKVRLIYNHPATGDVAIFDHRRTA